MTIVKYNVINQTVNNKLPFFDEKKGIFYVPVKHNYRYFVEAIIEDPKEGTIHYLILGKTKFDNNCRLCHTDNYGRVQVKIKGIFKDFIIEETRERANVDIEYIESTDDYDVFKIT